MLKPRSCQRQLAFSPTRWLDLLLPRTVLSSGGPLVRVDELFTSSNFPQLLRTPQSDPTRCVHPLQKPGHLVAAEVTSSLQKSEDPNFSTSHFRVMSTLSEAFSVRLRMSVEAPPVSTSLCFKLVLSSWKKGDNAWLVDAIWDVL